MTTTIALILRNISRNRVRMAIALSAIAFGVAALLVAGGFIEWIFYAIRESYIKSLAGHIQIVRPGYIARGAADPYRYLLPQRLPDLDYVEKLPGVSVVTPRVALAGLASRGDVTVSFMAEGVDPEKEKEASRYLIITTGEGLSSADESGIVMGAGLAEQLGAKTGDTIVLLVNTPSGGISALEVRVRGIFWTSVKAFDDVALRMPIGAAQRLLKTTGTHAWIVVLDRTELTEPVLDTLRKHYAGRERELEFVPWTDLADFYFKTVRLFSRQVGVVQIITALIILLSISNTLMMSVLERTGEIGTLLAIGTRRGAILRQFVGEGVALGLAGGALGVAIGLALAHLISAIGIPMPPPPGMSTGITGSILVTWPLATTSFLLAVGATIIASAYPAWKASRMNIVDALRHNR
jgi:putative ABC transport system permease protein